MVSRQRMNLRLAVLPLMACLTIGCSQKVADDKSKTAGNSKSKNDNSKSEVPNTPGSSGKKSTEGEKDTGTAEPIVADKFPRPENAQKPMYTSDTNTILFHQEGSVDDQAKFYTEELKKLGWNKKDSSEISDGVAFLDFAKGSLSITITINPLREGMITTIAQGNGLSVPASLEQDDDDLDEDESDEDHNTDN